MMNHNLDGASQNRENIQPGSRQTSNETAPVPICLPLPPSIGPNHVYDSISYNAFPVVLSNHLRPSIAPAGSHVQPYLHNSGYQITPMLPSRILLRKGKWSPEEEAYTAQIIKNFSTGVLQLPEGTTLRVYLAEKLQCDPMRITKKFTGSSCLGKRVYHSGEQTPASQEDILAANKELKQLEKKFLDQLARKSKKYDSNQDYMGSQPINMEYDHYQRPIVTEYAHCRDPHSHWDPQQVVIPGYDPNIPRIPVAYSKMPPYVQQFSPMHAYVHAPSQVVLPNEVSYPYAPVLVPQQYGGFSQQISHPYVAHPHSRMVHAASYLNSWNSNHKIQMIQNGSFYPKLDHEGIQQNDTNAASNTAESNLKHAVLSKRNAMLNENMLSRRLESAKHESANSSHCSDATTFESTNSNGSTGTENGSNSSGGESENRKKTHSLHYQANRRGLRNASPSSSEGSVTPHSTSNKTRDRNHKQVNLSTGKDGANAFTNFFNILTRQRGNQDKASVHGMRSAHTSTNAIAGENHSSNVVHPQLLRSNVSDSSQNRKRVKIAKRNMHELQNMQTNGRQSST